MCLHYVPSSFIKPLEFNAGSYIRDSSRRILWSWCNRISNRRNAPTGKRLKHTRTCTSTIIVDWCRWLSLRAKIYLLKNVNKYHTDSFISIINIYLNSTRSNSIPKYTKTQRNVHILNKHSLTKQSSPNNTHLGCYRRLIWKHHLWIILQI